MSMPNNESFSMPTYVAQGNVLAIISLRLLLFVFLLVLDTRRLTQTNTKHDSRL